jgi:hypoxanthine-DNA glycosylase
MVLGSFPGAASLAAGAYYAHPRNAFWPLIGAIVGEPLAGLPYDRRLARLLAHRIGLWDVVDACDRPGSLDADLRDVRPNDLNRLLTLAPRLAAVAFNGRTAGRHAPAMAAAGLRTAVLPSTSPAHAARSFADKLVIWRAFFAAVGVAAAAP